MHVLDNGICQTCAPSAHYLVDGLCEGCSDVEPLGEDEQALAQALHELDGQPVVARGVWDEGKHPRGPGGKFRSNVDRLKEAIGKHRAGKLDGHPFDGFSREQLRRVAKARGIEIQRGESHESISAKLLGHLGGQSTALVTEANDHPTGAAHIPTLSADAPGLKRYQELGKYVNDHLRGVTKTQTIPKETADQIVRDLDRLFAGLEPTTGDTVVWRGLLEPETLKAQRSIFGDGSAVGKSFTDPAFGSTAASKGSAETFGGVGGLRTPGATLVKINVPKGSKAVKIQGNLEREDEVLLPRGYTLKITADHIDDHGVRRMEADLVEPGT